MGIIKSSFTYMIGTVCGIYVAQNYDGSNIHKIYRTGLVAKHYEEIYHKPNKKDDDDAFNSTVDSGALIEDIKEATYWWISKRSKLKDLTKYKWTNLDVNY